MGIENPHRADDFRSAHRMSDIPYRERPQNVKPGSRKSQARRPFRSRGVAPNGCIGEQPEPRESRGPPSEKLTRPVAQANGRWCGASSTAGPTPSTTWNVLLTARSLYGTHRPRKGSVCPTRSPPAPGISRSTASTVPIGRRFRSVGPHRSDKPSPLPTSGPRSPPRLPGSRRATKLACRGSGRSRRTPAAGGRSSART